MTAPSPKREKDFWLSDRLPDNYGDDIYFDSYGLAWGIDTNGESCCVGKTEKVLAIINGKPISKNACAHTKRVLTKLINDRKEESDGADRPAKSRILRNRPARTSKSKASKPRLLKKGKRLPVRLPHQ